MNMREKTPMQPLQGFMNYLLVNGIILQMNQKKFIDNY
jgi:hypothetical protein